MTFDRALQHIRSGAAVYQQGSPGRIIDMAWLTVTADHGSRNVLTAAEILADDWALVREAQALVETPDL